MQKKMALKNKIDVPYLKRGSQAKKGENQCDFLSHLITSQPPQ
ncbi:hypothetical protein HS3_01608 [Bacillus subtilis]|nr:hypothetical protein HS3_01608 [Bacillus subtilis]